MKILLFIGMVFFVRPLYSAHMSHPIYQELIQTRIEFYQSNTIMSHDRINHIMLQLGELDSIYLDVYFATILAEYFLYGSEEDRFFIKTHLYPLYNEISKKMKKCKDPLLLFRMGDLSLIMTKHNLLRRFVYSLDVRTFFMKAKKYDKKNLKLNVGLGKWWVYHVLDSMHREFTHSLSKAMDYLYNDEILSGQLDEWDKIDLFNIYITRAQMNIKQLATQAAFEDLAKAEHLYPNAKLLAIMKKSFEDGMISWQ